MRGAVEKMPGVSACSVEPGKADIKVSYDPSKTNPDQLLEGLKAAGQPAKAK